MTIPTLTGEDEITKAINATLYATLKTLNKNGYISDEDVEKIEDDYIAVYISKNGGFTNWIRRRIGKEPTDMVVVVKTFY